MNTPALVGECGYIEHDYPSLFLPDRLWMTRHEGRKPTCIRWLAYLLSFGSFNRAIKESATGTSGSMKNISKGSLLGVQISLPTKAEQEAIAEALSDTDALIDSLAQLIAKKRHIKQGAMQELLTGKRRLPGFSEGWEVVTAGEIGKFRGGCGFPLKYQGLTEGAYPFYKVSDMNNEGNVTFMIDSNHWISEETRKALGAIIFPVNSIIFAKVGAAIFLERKKIYSGPRNPDNSLSYALSKNEK
jgi:type I restriction enzyme S subunit